MAHAPRLIADHFDDIFWPECTFDPPRLEGRRLIVPAPQIIVLGGHPLLLPGAPPIVAELWFDDVIDSRRTLTEYIGDPRQPLGFHSSYEVIDLAGADVPNGANIFRFEGVLTAPMAWVDWTVTAGEFFLAA